MRHDGIGAWLSSSDCNNFLKATTEQVCWLHVPERHGKGNDGEGLQTEAVSRQFPIIWLDTRVASRCIIALFYHHDGEGELVRQILLPLGGRPFCGSIVKHDGHMDMEMEMYGRQDLAGISRP